MTSEPKMIGANNVRQALDYVARGEVEAGFVYATDAAAQKDKNAADVREAARWYRELLTTFPDDAEAPQQRFLLAELLYDDQRWAEATVEFEKVAYEHAGHPRGADAGYTALLAIEAQRKAATGDEQARAFDRGTGGLRHKQRSGKATEVRRLWHRPTASAHWRKGSTTCQPLW